MKLNLGLDGIPTPVRSSDQNRVIQVETSTEPSYTAVPIIRPHIFRPFIQRDAGNNRFPVPRGGFSPFSISDPFAIMSLDNSISIRIFKFVIL